MADENRNQEKKPQRANEQDWSSDPTHTPGQQAANPGDKQYDKTDPMRRSQTPNQGSRPGSPGSSDDDATIREPNTGDAESRRGGLGNDETTGDEESRRGGMGKPGAGDKGGMGGGTPGGSGRTGGSENR